MNKDQEIIDLFKELSKQKDLFSFAIVESVDEEKATCVVKLNDLEIQDVRLKSVINDNYGVYNIPATGSIVLIARLISSDNFFLLNCSKIDKTIINLSDEINLTINKVDDEIVFNGGSLESFITDINKLVNKLNAIEIDINDIKQVFSNWVPAPQDGGAALKTATANWAAGKLTETVIDDIKDPKIKN